MNNNDRNKKSGTFLCFITVLRQLWSVVVCCGPLFMVRCGNYIVIPHPM